MGERDGEKESSARKKPMVDGKSFKILVITIFRSEN